MPQGMLLKLVLSQITGEIYIMHRVRCFLGETTVAASSSGFAWSGSSPGASASAALSLTIFLRDLHGVNRLVQSVFSRRVIDFFPI